MKAHRALLFTGLVYLLAWFLPSARVDVWLDTVVAHGWDATLVALTPRDAPVALQILMFTSGLTNVLFIAAGVLAWVRPHRVSRGLEWGVWVAALVNTHWFVIPAVDRSELRAGYYLWVVSFLLLGATLHRMRTASPAKASQPAEA